jgi:signal transduction histidine kinase
VYQIFFNSTLSLLQRAFLILIFCSPLRSLAQQETIIDSLTTELENPAHSTEIRCDLNSQLAVAHIKNGRSDIAIKYVNEADQIAYTLADSFRIIKAGRLKGQTLRRLDSLRQSIGSFAKVLPMAERQQNDPDIYLEYKDILNGLAICYTFYADYDKALEYHFRSLLLLEKEGDKKGMSIILNNIGLVYYRLKNFSIALEYYKKSLALKRADKSTYDLDRLLINIGLCYNHFDDYNEAEKYFKEAFVVCGAACSDNTKIEGQFGLGVSNFGRGNDDEALNNFQMSYETALKINDKRWQAENLNYLSRIQIRNNQDSLAIITLFKSEELALNAGYKELLIETYQQLSSFFNSKKQFEQAANYQNKYIQLKDSVYSERLIENLAKVQTKYAERENIATIAAKEEVIRRQRSLNVAIVIIAILGALLIFVLFRSNQVKKKVNAALSEAKSIIEDQNRQLLNSNIHLDKELKEKNIDLEKANESLRRVNDELDNFIYKTSHDIRGPLASLKGMCNVALLDVKDPIALNYLHKLDITAEKLNTILTRLLIVNQINNSTLEAEKIDFHQIVSEVLLLEKKKGLPPRLAIRKRIEENIEFHADREFVRIIIENLIDNAIKFYNDSQRVDPFVEIDIKNDGESIRIRVTDNGIGISQAQPDKIFQMFSRASERSETGGIGLYITKTAVQKLGGTINLKTTPEGYTEFYVNLPFSTQKVVA